MACLLRVVQPGSLTTFMDSLADPYLPCICGTTATTLVTCELYPLEGAASVQAATVTVIDPHNNATPANVAPVGGANGMLSASFSVGGAGDGGLAGSWNAIVVTGRDNNGQTTSFTFYYYKSRGATPTQPPTTAPFGMKHHRPGPETKKGKGKK
jgi:hypothetical protein